MNEPNRFITRFGRTIGQPQRFGPKMVRNYIRRPSFLNQVFAMRRPPTDEERAALMASLPEGMSSKTRNRIVKALERKSVA